MRQFMHSTHGGKVTRQYSEEYSEWRSVSGFEADKETLSYLNLRSNSSLFLKEVY